MRKRTEVALWSAVVVASLGLHAAAFGGLGPSRNDGFGGKKRRPPALVEMSVAPAKEVPLPPEVPKPAAAPRVAMARPARARVARASAPPAAPTLAPPPTAESPADFTGVTMTNDGPGAGWASATGNGQAMNGAVGRPGARVTHRNVDGDADSSNGAPGVRTVGLADLSRPPSLPTSGPFWSVCIRRRLAARALLARRWCGRASCRMDRCANWPWCPSPRWGLGRLVSRPCGVRTGRRRWIAPGTPCPRSSITPAGSMFSRLGAP